jgi:hypothetical protein
MGRGGSHGEHTGRLDLRSLTPALSRRERGLRGSAHRFSGGAFCNGSLRAQSDPTTIDAVPQGWPRNPDRHRFPPALAAHREHDSRSCPSPRPVFPSTAARCHAPSATVREDQRPRRSTQWCNIISRAGWRSSARAGLGRTRSLYSSSTISVSTWTAAPWPRASGVRDVLAVLTSPHPDQHSGIWFAHSSLKRESGPASLLSAHRTSFIHRTKVSDSHLWCRLTRTAG